MPHTQKEWIKILKKAGWVPETGGNHQTKMTKSGERPITLPEHKGATYSKGLDAAIKKQANL